VKTKSNVVLIIFVVFVALMLSSCSKNEIKTEPAEVNAESKVDNNETKNQESQSSQVQEEKETPEADASNNEEATEQGQKITVDKFKFALPDDWKGNSDTQVWFPGTENENEPIPAHSLHHGARPLMGNPSFEDGIKAHIGVEPQNKKEHNVDQLEGIMCQWQRGKYKSVGLFLFEKDAGMNMLYFFTCQAPEDSFDQYVGTYETILESVELN